MLQTPCYRPSAALTSFTPSSLAHSAGPDNEASSHPFGSISSVVGMPIALPLRLLQCEHSLQVETIGNIYDGYWFGNTRSP